MNILCIPDVHCRKFWKRDLEHINDYNKIVFLGDYIDPYPSESNLEDEFSTLNNIIEIKKKYPEKIILLLGNHDIHYIGDVKQSSRYNYLHAEKLTNIYKENLSLFNLVFCQDNVIFSHAGITEEWRDYVYKEIGFSDFDDLLFYLSTVKLDSDDKILKILDKISRFRSWTNSYIGSCVWADLREHLDLHKSSLEHIVPKCISPKYYQVFGHTQVIKPIITECLACLDCRKCFKVNTITHEICENSL